MKVRTKIFLLCMCGCLFSVLFTGIVATESMYTANLLEARDQFRNDAERIIALTKAYLDLVRWGGGTDGAYGSPATRDRIFTAYRLIVDGFRDKDMVLLIRDGSIFYWSPGHAETRMPKIETGEVDPAGFAAMSITFRSEAGNRFLVVNDRLYPGATISLVRNVTYIEDQRRAGYAYFTGIGVLVVVFLLLVVPVFARRITLPLERLAGVTESMIAGDYGKRADASGNDEISLLARRFDFMAATVEKTVGEQRAAGERRERFIAALVHELHTPLTSVIGYAEYLGSVRYDETVFGTCLDHLHSEGKRMLALSDNLMNLILYEKIEVPMREEALQPVFDEVIAVMRIKADGKKAVLAADGGELTVRADRNLLKEMFINLVDNALNAVSSGGSVALSAGKLDGRTFVRVKDDGIGIPHGETEKIFEPFYRVDPSRDRSRGGAGLGLSVCREIARLHGAEITIESVPGAGTDVTVRF